jgi:hypothetical protein
MEIKELEKKLQNFKALLQSRVDFNLMSLWRKIFVLKKATSEVATSRDLLLHLTLKWIERGRGLLL